MFERESSLQLLKGGLFCSETMRGGPRGDEFGDLLTRAAECLYEYTEQRGSTYIFAALFAELFLALARFDFFVLGLSFFDTFCVLSQCRRALKISL